MNDPQEIPCASGCGAMLLRDVESDGNKVIFRVRCAKCKILWKAEMTRKIVVTLTKIAVILLIFGAARAVAEKLTCKRFSTQHEAQEAYNGDPVKYAKLDGYDKDGKVCEYLKK